MKTFVATIVGVLLGGILYAQLDTLPRTFRRVDLFPAISYSPETKLTLGVAGYYYFDLAKTSPATRLSQVEFVAVYTLADQMVAETKWDAFSDDNAWRYRGELYFNRFPDRNYGLGNDAGLLIADIEDDVIDTLNYLRFTSDRIKFTPVVLKRVGAHFYLGMQGHLEYLYNLKPIADNYYLINEGSANLLDFPVEGLRIGLGINALYDSRDNIINPLRGSYVEFSNHFFSHHFGSDFDYSSFRLDGRHYIPVAGDHTLALRSVVNFRFSDEPIPLRGLSRVGGTKFMRGYFKGTYQDNHLLAFELEYRWPFWNEDLDAPWWKLWKRMGIVGFVGGAQVMHQPSDFSFNRFNMSAGGGVRFLFNKVTRLNIRIDYGFGLSKNSGGPGLEQSGLYFYLAEAF